MYANIMYSKKKLINKKNKRRLSKKKKINGKKPLFRLYAKRFVKYS
jgi:hypothetical protein